MGRSEPPQTPLPALALELAQVKRELAEVKITKFVADIDIGSRFHLVVVGLDVGSSSNCIAEQRSLA